MSMLVNPYAYSGIDSDVKNFLEATGITDTTTKNAIKTLVADLKSANVWDKLNAIYPIVGGTATTHKYNLKNPLDTDAAFRLTFYGGWTHSANGMLPNGSTGYANSHFNPSTDVVSIASFSFGFYSRTDDNSGVQVDIGAYNSGTDATCQICANFSNFAYCQPNSGGNAFTIPQVGSTGFYLGSRTGASNHYFQRNATQTTRTEINLAPSYKIYIGARNSTGTTQYYSKKQLAFAFIGSALSSGDGSSLYTIVNTFETALGRNV